jgi:hypothetical protein
VRLSGHIPDRISSHKNRFLLVKLINANSQNELFAIWPQTNALVGDQEGYVA